MDHDHAARGPKGDAVTGQCLRLVRLPSLPTDRHGAGGTRPTGVRHDHHHRRRRDSVGGLDRGDPLRFEHYHHARPDQRFATPSPPGRAHALRECRTGSSEVTGSKRRGPSCHNDPNPPPAPSADLWSGRDSLGARDETFAIKEARHHAPRTIIDDDEYGGHDERHRHGRTKDLEGHQ